MNIKIKSAGVTCLVGDDYDRVYTALKNQLNDEDEQLFTERIPGHEYLQWELPGEGWTPLSESDPLMAQEVRQELLRRRQNISQRFGKNQEMAQRILSVPDDSYVYYKANTGGKLLVKLTAWGYRYPERVGGGGTTGIYKPKGETQLVCIHITYDNKPLTNKEFFINEYKRVTDDAGIYNVGELPIDYKFEIKVDDRQQIIDVQRGHGDIHIDTTLLTSVEIKATLDGQPYSGATAFLSYWGHELTLTTDSNGNAYAKVPIDPDNGMCSISLENKCQQLPLVQPTTVFVFNIISPPPKEKIEDIPEKPFVNEKGDDDIKKTNQEIEDIKDSPRQSKDDPTIKIPEEENNDTPKLAEQQHSTPLIVEMLVALSLIALVVLTYVFCYGMLL